MVETVDVLVHTERQQVDFLLIDDVRGDVVAVLTNVDQHVRGDSVTLGRLLNSGLHVVDGVHFARHRKALHDSRLHLGPQALGFVGYRNVVVTRVRGQKKYEQDDDKLRMPSVDGFLLDARAAAFAVTPEFRLNHVNFLCDRLDSGPPAQAAPEDLSEERTR